MSLLNHLWLQVNSLLAGLNLRNALPRVFGGVFGSSCSAKMILETTQGCAGALASAITRGMILSREATLRRCAGSRDWIRI